MFKELAALAKSGLLTITIASSGKDKLQITVSQKPHDVKLPGELVSPVSITGTPEELDTDLAKVLSDYAATHLDLFSQWEKQKAGLTAAAATKINPAPAAPSTTPAAKAPAAAATTTTPTATRMSPKTVAVKGKEAPPKQLTIPETDENVLSPEEEEEFANCLV